MATFKERLNEAKADSLSQPLIRAARLLTELGLARKQTRARQAPRPAHMALYPHIDFGGTRPTHIAERLGITPQAVAQLVGDLEDMGLVERVPDPSDRRARLVRFTAKGQRDLLAGFRALSTIEADIENAMGKRDLRRLVHLVRRLEQVVEEIWEAETR